MFLASCLMYLSVWTPVVDGCALSSNCSFLVYLSSLSSPPPVRVMVAMVTRVGNDEPESDSYPAGDRRNLSQESPWAEVRLSYRREEVI